MNATDPAAWAAFGTAMVGAAGALTGLVFVAISINLTRILSFASLPERAAESVILLLAVLAASALVLVPGQAAGSLGAQFAFGGVALALCLALTGRARPDVAYHSTYLPRVVMGQSVAAAYIILGLSLLAGAGGGLDWLVVADFAGVAVAVFNSWVLLIEINR